MSKDVSVIVVGAGGRMGQELTRLVLSEADLHLAAAVDRQESLPDLEHLGCPVVQTVAESLAVAPAAVVVDFSSPTFSMEGARIATEAGAPMVIGTTGLDSRQKEELALLAEKTPLLWSANMSIGVNVLLRILPELARALGPAYDMEMVEIHHKRKKDAPSGTALMLGEALAGARGWDLADVRVSGRDGLIGERKSAEIGVQALRGGDVVGIHTTWFLGPGENIQVTHQAESRSNFAQGALRAARWLKNMPAGRLYSMQDVVGQSS